MAIFTETPRYYMVVNGQVLHYTRSGIIVDHTSQRIRGCVVTIEPDDGFSKLLRTLRLKQVIKLQLTTSGAEMKYDGDAEVVMIRERFDRRSAPAISFIFRMLQN